MILDIQIAHVEHWERAIADMKASGQTHMVVKVNGRKPKPDSVRTRVFPGVMGRLVQWGDGTDRMPTMADIRVVDLERFIARCRAEIESNRRPRPRSAEEEHDA